MNASRRFLLTVAATYVAAAALGLALFHSPQYSRAYLAESGKDHARYVKLLKHPELARYRQRPALNPLTETLAADAAFVQAYEERPAFRREERRIFAYILWFKLLNTAALLGIVLHYGRRPLLKFLDAQILQTKNTLDEAAEGRESAEQDRAAAQTQMDAWPTVEEQIRIRTERALEVSLMEVRQQTQFAREQIARDIKNRKSAELNMAIRTLKEELVTQALRELEARYRREATPEQMALNVNHFVRLMDHLS